MPSFSVNLYPKRSARSIPLFKVMCFPKTVEANAQMRTQQAKKDMNQTSGNRDSNIFKEYQNGFPTQFLPRD